MTKYVDIATGTKAMDVPTRIVLPVHHADPVPWAEEQVFTADSPDWDEQLQRWAFLHGFMPAKDQGASA